MPSRTLVSAALALVAGVARPTALPGPLHAGCAPSACTLELPTAEERRAMLDEADRLAARYGSDSSSLGRQCRALGATMRARLDDVRMLPVMWRAPDPEGHLAA